MDDYSCAWPCLSLHVAATYGESEGLTLLLRCESHVERLDCDQNNTSLCLCRFNSIQTCRSYTELDSHRNIDEHSKLPWRIAYGISVTIRSLKDHPSLSSLVFNIFSHEWIYRQINKCWQNNGCSSRDNGQEWIVKCDYPLRTTTIEKVILLCCIEYTRTSYEVLAYNSGHGTCLISPASFSSLRSACPE